MPVLDVELVSSWEEVDAAAQAIANGVQKTQMAQSVRTSLGKADEAWARLYWVTISRAGGSYTCDNTLAEIQSAQLAGAFVRAHLPDGFEADLSNDDGGAMFYALDNSGGPMVVMRYTVAASGVSFDSWPIGGSGSGLTEEIKQALLECFEHVAWVDGQGQTYYDRLYNALYPSASIVSITAAFDQGTNIIYTDDSLDTLRQYLTVTATYDDASTEVVDSYVLTGTLVAGVSTIRVLYSGLQTTFQCNVTQQILPPGYTRLDYVRVINSTAAPVYVLTGIVPDGGTSATYKFAINSVSATGHLASGSEYYLPFFRNGKLFANRLHNEYDSAFSGLAAKTPYTIDAYISGNEISVDGETETSLSIGARTSTEISLFTYNKQTTPASLLFIGRLYFMKIYQNGTLVRDYIPCMNDNNVVGFYDAVEQNFVTSATQNPLYPPE